MSHAISHPVPAVIAVVARRKKVLLVRRKNPPDAGLWGFPGGKIDLGETIAAAAERELHEETGLVGRAQAVLTTLDVIHRARTRPTLHYLLVVVLCRYRRGRILAADDAADARWYSENELAKMRGQLSRDVLRVARSALSGARSRDPRPKLG